MWYNWEYLTKITSKYEDFTTKWFIHLSNVTKCSIKCFKCKFVDYWSFIPNEKLSLNNQSSLFAVSC